MCYRLHLATPLTLSEVRSMLPDGVTAHAASPAERELLLEHLPRAQTIVELRRGTCACDFFVQRDPAGRSDETHIRERGIRTGVSRAALAEVIAAHRLPRKRVPPLSHWQEALAGFVAEHARNAGPSVYHRGFTRGARAVPTPEEAVTVTVTEVRDRPDRWLAPDRVTLVVRH